MAKFLTDNYCCTTFYPTHCVFQDLSTKLIVAVGKKAGGLYTFDSSQHSDKASVSAANASAVPPSSSLRHSQAPTPCDQHTCKSHDLDILHARLGHTSFSKMQYIKDCKPYLANDFFCETCVLAKFHRLPFNKSTITSKAPF